jgi:heme exporter protein D
MDLGPHAFFIVAAYAVTALVIVGLILRAVLDHRMQMRAIAELERRGVRRRSIGAEPPFRSSQNGVDAAANRSG